MAVTITDVENYLGTQPGLAPLVGEVMEQALEAAEERITERCMTLADPRPEVVDQAVIMLTARLYRRRFSVSGFEGFGDLGIARVPALDPDIEDLLIRYLRYDFA